MADEVIDVSQLCIVMKSLFYILSRTMKTLVGQLVLERCKRISFRISAESHNLQVRFVMLIGNSLNIVQGFSDPIYTEAYVKMQGFDILLGKCS